MDTAEFLAVEFYPLVLSASFVATERKIKELEDSDFEKGSLKLVLPDSMLCLLLLLENPRP